MLIIHFQGRYVALALKMAKNADIMSGQPQFLYSRYFLAN